MKKNLNSFLKNYEWLFTTNLPPKPQFVTTVLKSEISIGQVILDISTMLPQLNNFISQFHSLISDNNINVITDSLGNMDIEVPKNIVDEDAEKLAKRIGILDRLITNHNNNLQDLFKRGYILDKTSINPNEYQTQLDEKMKIYESMIAKYRH